MSRMLLHGLFPPYNVSQVRTFTLEITPWRSRLACRCRYLIDRQPMPAPCATPLVVRLENSTDRCNTLQEYGAGIRPRCDQSCGIDTATDGSEHVGIHHIGMGKPDLAL